MTLPDIFLCWFGLVVVQFGIVSAVAYVLDTFFSPSPIDLSPSGAAAGILGCSIWVSPVTAAMATAAIYARRKGSRYPPGHCQACGYNLTGNESGVCPECATPVARQEARA